VKLTDSPLIIALRDPGVILRFTDAEWDLIVRQGYATGLLGRLGAMMLKHGLKTQIPVPVWRHMEAMLTIAEKQRRAVLWEVSQLSRALVEVNAPVMLLKGAAYAAAELAPAAGRTFSDIDILVPKSALPEVEMHLMLSGWIAARLDPYDQRYYRQWMHELPPMTHIRRGTNLDLHHNILPETARIKTRPDLILSSAQHLAGFANIFIPCPADQVLHSATHLYHEGEWEHGLRDLSDLDCLLRAYGEDSGFWADLMARARELNLAGPLSYALSNAKAIFQTPVPDLAQHSALYQTRTIQRRMMNSLFVAGMTSAHPSLRHPGTGLAQFLLYVRSHWLRMPMHLLIPHLLHKAIAKLRIENSEIHRSAE
jgi:hypothetical protein